MAINFGKVAVLFGGNNAEREVSLNSGKAVLNALIKQGVNAHAVDPRFDDISQIKAQGFERAFIVLHGRGGEDGVIQGFLNALDIPFTGSDVSSSAIGMDKAKTKQIWQSCLLPTAPYQIITKDDFEVSSVAQILEKLSGTVMVKPVHEGSSIGMAKAASAEQLIDALTEAFKFDDKVLLEAWITGDEFTVSMLGDKVLPAISMKTSNEFYDYQAKYQSTDTQYLCPCGLNDEDLLELNTLAESAFKAIGCSGWGRVDFMRDKDKNWFLLEVNTVPGMTETSLVPKAAKQAGISFEQLVLTILEQTL